jgi:hypothetical protein
MSVEGQTKIRVSIEEIVENQLLSDILCTAIEDGSNYWAAYANIKREKDEYLSADFHDTEDGEFKGTINLSSVATGMERIINIGEEEAKTKFYSKRLRQQVLELIFEPDNASWDAGTADSIIQAALFDEVVYG